MKNLLLALILLTAGGCRVGDTFESIEGYLSTDTKLEFFTDDLIFPKLFLKRGHYSITMDQVMDREPYFTFSFFDEGANEPRGKIFVPAISLGKDRCVKSETPKSWREVCRIKADDDGWKQNYSVDVISTLYKISEKSEVKYLDGNSKKSKVTTKRMLRTFELVFFDLDEKKIAHFKSRNRYFDRVITKTPR
jgi:hypothetical protein